MSKFFILVVIITLPIFSYAQTDPKTDPENIIITIDENGNKSTQYKNELIKNPDSIHYLVIDEVLKKYFIDKDSVEVSKFLIGKWKFKMSTRTNGKKDDITASMIREFKKNGKFLEVSKNTTDTITGRWQFSKNFVGNLNLLYDKTQYLVKDKAIWDTLDEETKKRLSYNRTTLTVHQINRKQLRFVTRIIIDSPDPTADPYFRIVFIDYEKTE